MADKTEQALDADYTRDGLTVPSDGGHTCPTRPTGPFFVITNIFHWSIEFRPVTPFPPPSLSFAAHATLVDGFSSKLSQQSPAAIEN
ncbi:hypothetical protein SprV_0802592600 [Sparganum proliferum]